MQKCPRTAGHAMATRVTVKDLQREAIEFLKSAPEELRAHPANASWWITRAVLCEAFGLDWANRHLSSAGPPADYLRGNRDDRDRGRGIGELRVHFLAEFIFNMQGLPGLVQRLREMQSRLDIDGMFAELAWPALLLKKQVPIEFREEPIRASNQKNPDLIVYSPYGPLLTEVKGRPEGHGLGPRTVSRLLRDAREQLAPALAIPNPFAGGLALVWLPATSGNEPTDVFDAYMKEAEREFFSASSTPPHVFGVMREVFGLPEGGAAMLAMEPTFVARPGDIGAEELANFLRASWKRRSDWPYWILLNEISPVSHISRPERTEIPKVLGRTEILPPDDLRANKAPPIK